MVDYHLLAVHVFHILFNEHDFINIYIYKYRFHLFIEVDLKEKKPDTIRRTF